MIIKKRSIIDGKTYKMDIPITEQQLDLTPDQREFLMAGITPEVWDEIFGGDEGD